MIIYSSPLAELIKHRDASMLHLIWKPDSRLGSDADVRNEFDLLLGFVNEHKPILLCSDSTHYPFHGNMEMQNWLDFEYFPRLGTAGIKAFAVVAEPSAVDEFNDEKGGLFSIPEVRYFVNHDEASEWLETFQ